MDEKRKISRCTMCGRGIMSPPTFCTKNCEEHWNSGFRLKEKNYENYYKVSNWTVVVGNEETLTGWHIRA